tara:strand:- start:920 stop:1924 length:1005 start_codon:yes stop_codon:yes gene_type:complete
MSKLNHLHCPVCNKINLKQLNYINQPDYGDQVIDFSAFKIKYCEDCGFGYSIPDVGDELLDRFYTYFYRTNKNPHFINFNKLRIPKTSECKAAVEHILLARTYTQFEKGDKFLDIGPGPGWHFQALKTLMDEPTLYAIEHSEGSANAYKRNYGVETFSEIKILQDKLGQDKLKCIFASHSIEHMKFNALNELLGNIKEVLLDDGLLVIEVPHSDMRLHYDRSGDAPHLLFFSIESLKKLLIDSGFEVIFINTSGAKSSHEFNSSALLNSQVSPIVVLYRILFPMRFRKSNLKNKIKSLLLYWLGSSNKIKFSQLKVDYGGDRQNLRAIAMKKST